MPTSNEEIFDAALRHQIYLLRHSNMIANAVINILNGGEEEIVRHIRDKLAKLQQLRSSKDWAQWQQLRKNLTVIRSQVWKDATELLSRELVQLAIAEPRSIDNIVTTALPVQIEFLLPTKDMLTAIVSSRPFEGDLLREWASQMAANDIKRLHNVIQAGMVAGETTEKIVSRVVGTDAAKGSDGITEMTRNQVRTVTRTAVQFVANSSRDAWFELNKDVISGELYVATLDSRTTPVCRALDGKVFKLGQGPRPPIHFNCRSLRVPAIDGGRLGDRPFKPTTEKMLVKEYAEKNDLDGVKSRDGLPRGHKGSFDEYARKRTRELVGQVPAKTDYDTWLRRQKKEFQDEVLGPARAKLFRDGMKLDRFVDNHGEELTLAEIYKREGIAGPKN